MGVELLDKYSVLHFGVGVLARVLGIGVVPTLVAHVVFEVVENSEAGMRFINEEFRTWWPGGKDYADAPINILGDNISVLAGWYTARELHH